MTSYTKLIDENLVKQAVKDLDAIGKYAKIALRLQAIISSKENNILQTARFLGFDRASIARWIKRFKQYGIAGLEDKHGRGRKTLFTCNSLNFILQYVFSDSENFNNLNYRKFL